LIAVQEALLDRDAPRLREAAHKLSGMASAFSTVAGGVASELEDHAEQGRVEKAQPLVARLETMVEELLRLVDGLTLDVLIERLGNGGEPCRLRNRQVDDRPDRTT
jgi:HPt (histidine-containing phosphotransfer) domain-containing protein